MASKEKKIRVETNAMQPAKKNNPSRSSAPAAINITVTAGKVFDSGIGIDTNSSKPDSMMTDRDDPDNHHRRHCRDAAAITGR